MFYSILQGLCRDRGLTVSAALKIMGMSCGNMTRWREGSMPNGKTLRRMAQFFSVPVDYLVGKKQDVYALQQKKLLALFDALGEADREAALSAWEDEVAAYCGGKGSDVPE